MATIVWYGCEKEVETSCGYELRVADYELRVTGYELRVLSCGIRVMGLRAMASLVLVADYLILYSKMKKSVAADNFICY